MSKSIKKKNDKNRSVKKTSRRTAEKKVKKPVKSKNTIKKKSVSRAVTSKQQKKRANMRKSNARTARTAARSKAPVRGKAIRGKSNAARSTRAAGRSGIVKGTHKNEVYTYRQRQSMNKTKLNMKKNSYKTKRSHKRVKKDISKITLNEDYKKSVSPIIESLTSNVQASEYLIKNVSKNAIDVISLLKKPMSDEDIEVLLGMKKNAVRRMLNRMHGYGITNYNVSRNKEGWLSFTWYIDTKRVPEFFDYVDSTNQPATILTDECNDYFICDKCYPDNKLILTFDAAYESNFKCVCDSNLSRISKQRVSEIMEKSQASN